MTEWHSPSNWTTPPFTGHGMMIATIDVNLTRDALLIFAARLTAAIMFSLVLASHRAASAGMREAVKLEAMM